MRRDGEEGGGECWRGGGQDKGGVELGLPTDVSHASRHTIARRLGAGFTLGPRKERRVPPIDLPHQGASHLHAGLYCTVSPLSSAFSEGYGGGRSFRRAVSVWERGGAVKGVVVVGGGVQGV